MTKAYNVGVQCSCRACQCDGGTISRGGFEEKVTDKAWNRSKPAYLAHLLKRFQITLLLHKYTPEKPRHSLSHFSAYADAIHTAKFKCAPIRPGWKTMAHKCLLLHNLWFCLRFRWRYKIFKFKLSFCWCTPRFILNHYLCRRCCINRFFYLITKFVTSLRTKTNHKRYLVLAYNHERQQYQPQHRTEALFNRLSH